MLSTASDHRPRAFRDRPLLHALLAAYGALWAWAAVAPVSRAEWAIENVLPLSVLAFLALSFRRLQLSDLSYVALAAFLALHAVGAHYGYEATPAGAWLQRTLALARNPYDRVVHLAFGLCVTYPLRELLLWRHRRHQGWAAYHALEAVLAFSAVYEVLEWLVAREATRPGLGAAFVGAQGDRWDAQWDMALAGGGALVTLGAVALARRAWAAVAPHAFARARAVAPWRPRREWAAGD
jgi:putative membrane protein